MLCDRVHDQAILLGRTCRSRCWMVPRFVALVTGSGYAFTGGRELKRMLSAFCSFPLPACILQREHRGVPE
jgi:hypothetical protein